MPYGSRLAATMTRRLGRECVYTPSARLALYLALRRWCRPGARVLMSPVNDDVILFVVLAAGLRPVQAPVSVWDGNIDPAAVPESTWRNVDAVLTTNLYGVPDRVLELRRRCEQLGIPLFEDAAHAIGSHVAGQPVGTFGRAAAFSLSKHVAGMAGGFLAVEDARTRRELELLRDDLLTPGRLREDLVTTLRPLARSAVRSLHLVRPVWRTMERLGLMERDAFRMDLHAQRLTASAREAPSLTAYERWVRVDLHGYRSRHGALVRGQLKLRMARLDEDLARRRAGVALLAGTPWASPALRDRTAHDGPLPSSGCRSWSTTATRSSSGWCGTTWSAATSTTRRWTTTRARSSSNPPPIRRPPAGSPRTRSRPIRCWPAGSWARSRRSGWPTRTPRCCGRFRTSHRPGCWGSELRHPDDRSKHQGVSI